MHADDAANDPRKITKEDQRRMTKSLNMAGWEKKGRFTAGNRRNQVRFVRII